MAAVAPPAVLYHSPPSTEDLAPDDLAALLEAFTLRFEFAPAAATLHNLLGDAEVAPWYKTWRKERAKSKALRSYLRPQGLTDVQWAQVAALLPGRKEVRVAFWRRRMAIAEEYDRAIFLDVAEAAALVATDSPLMAVVEAGYSRIPLRWKGWVEAFDAASRPWGLQFAKSLVPRALILQIRDAIPRRLADVQLAAAGVPGRPGVGTPADWYPTMAVVDAYIVNAPAGAALM